MAEFEPAYKKTNTAEGGYANNPADSGGETYKGIARNHHPKWSGWKHIDALKQATNPQPYYGSGAYRNWVRYIDKTLAQVAPLQQLVKTFYLNGFWDANRLGEIIDQDVADWVYDHIVNAGARGVMWIQLAAAVIPDGELGPRTLSKINSKDPAELLARAEDIAGAYRLDRAHDKPDQIQFLTSWLRRDGQPEAIIALVKQAASDGRLDDSEVATLTAAMAATA